MMTDHDRDYRRAEIDGLRSEIRDLRTQLWAEQRYSMDTRFYLFLAVEMAAVLAMIAVISATKG